MVNGGGFYAILYYTDNDELVTMGIKTGGFHQYIFTYFYNSIFLSFSLLDSE